MSIIKAVTFESFELSWRQHQLLANKEVPEKWKSWLLDKDSLTTRLRNECNGQFGVEVLQQSFQTPNKSERSLMRLKERHAALTREVTLLCGETPWVIARTVIPFQTLKGRSSQLKRLGNRPMGHFLFSDPALERSPIEVSKCRLFIQLANGESESILAWGRRSQFIFYRKPLLVSEFFLPELLSRNEII